MRFECLALAASPHVLDSHGRAWVDLGEAGTTEKTAGRIIKCALVIRAASMCVLRGMFMGEKCVFWYCTTFHYYLTNNIQL